MEKLIEKYKEYLKNEIEECNCYLHNLDISKIKHVLGENLCVSVAHFSASDTKNPDYTLSIVNRQKDANSILEYFSSNGKNFFLCFNSLGNTLLNSNFKTNEKIEIIKYFIVKNIETISDNKKFYLFNMNKIHKLKLKYLTIDELISLIEKSEIDIFLRKKFFFDKIKINKQRELKEILPDILDNPNIQIDIQRKIYNEFIIKEELTEEDINMFSESLIIRYVTYIM